ncbi:restriction endonuclease subunit S [Vibrio fluvialis]|nr:restriction endonuclease subunit S [Vibrio fluvialis]
MVTIYKLAPEKIATRRVDPWHYQPKFENQILKVEKVGSASLQCMIDTDRGVAGGATPLGANYLSKGRVRFYRTSEVDNMHLSASDAVFISDEDDEKLKRSRLEVGDVLLTITGAKFGKSAVVEEEHLPGNISQHSVRFHPLDGVLDPYFLVSYFESKPGQIAIWREAYGATRPAIDFPSIGSLVVPQLVFDAQKYIGEKVRQAERLRAWAKNAEKVFNQALKSAYPNVFNKMGSGNCYSFARSQEIDYTLNVGAFDEERLLTQRYLYEHGGRKLAEIAKIANESTSEYEENQVYIGLSSIASHSCELKPSTIAEQEVTGTCRILKSGPVVAKLRPYLNKVSYIPEKLSGSLGSTELLCIEPNKDTSGWFIYGVLKSELTLKQLRPLASGATHPRIDQYDLRNIVIPSVENPHELGQLLEQAQTAYFLSEKCTKLAKLLVEDLIEGQLNESQLASAQQALETGDDSLDRALLERMTAEGMDGEGDPLFDDIEQLYDLLEQAKQALDADNAMAEA